MFWNFSQNCKRGPFEIFNIHSLARFQTIEGVTTSVRVVVLYISDYFCCFFERRFFFSGFSWTTWWKDFRIYQFWIEGYRVNVLTKQSRAWYKIADWIRNWMNKFKRTSYIYPPSIICSYSLTLISIEILVTFCNFAAKFWSALAFRQCLFNFHS